MATIRKIVEIDAPIAKVWDALADFHNVHTRVAPGFLTGSEPDGDVRVVHFSNGSVARETLIAIDEANHRVAYAIKEGRATHHNASAELVAEGANKTRFIWTTDILPNELAPYVDAQMTEGLKHMKPTLERP
jgi:carbon monoxide dehydrogenase subunit G